MLQHSSSDVTINLNINRTLYEVKAVTCQLLYFVGWSGFTNYCGCVPRSFLITASHCFKLGDKFQYEFR